MRVATHRMEPKMSRLSRCLILVLVAALVGCASDAAPTGDAAPTQQEVLLKIDQGIVFETGAITEGAAMQASDLVVMKHGDDVDLKSGVEPNSTDHLPMKVFRLGDQVTSQNAIFDDLDKVPATHPYTTGDFLRRAAKGNGLVVQNNISKGHTKVFVDLYNAPGKQVRLHYLVIP